MPFPPDGPRLMQPASANAQLPLRGITILAVEDSRVTCDLLRLICQRSGARMKRADSLTAARAHLACYRPDVAIIDLGLPDGPGTDLISALAATGLPVLAISGNPDGRTHALEAGAVAFLDKPLPSVTGFVRLIRQLVAGAGAEVLVPEHATPEVDPMTLRDDLTRAAVLVLGQASDLAYAAGFVRSLARTAGDAALERAAMDVVEGSGREVLAGMIAERLKRLQLAC